MTIAVDMGRKATKTKQNPVMADMAIFLLFKNLPRRPRQPWRATFVDPVPLRSSTLLYGDPVSSTVIEIVIDVAAGKRGVTS